MSVVQEVTTKAEPVVGGKTAASSALLEQFLEYVHKPEVGDLPGLVKKFESAGLSAQIQSWIAGGKPLPVTPDQITLAIGSGEIANMATKTGLPASEVAEQLTHILPEAINHLTPGGKLPTNAMFGELAGSLKDKFAK